ncbi:MAG TPA: hypothetical protein VM285_15515 [Polyangia bacterium]|nr:hypothetical protein [Polyangia bacterium]
MVDAHSLGAGVNREWQTVAFACLVDRVVVALSEGHPGARVHRHLDDVLVPGPALDLLDGPRRVLLGDRD